MASCAWCRGSDRARRTAAPLRSTCLPRARGADDQFRRDEDVDVLRSIRCDRDPFDVSIAGDRIVLEPPLPVRGWAGFWLPQGVDEQLGGGGSDPEGVCSGAGDVARAVAVGSRVVGADDGDVGWDGPAFALQGGHGSGGHETVTAEEGGWKIAPTLMVDQREDGLRARRVVVVRLNRHVA